LSAALLRRAQLSLCLLSCCACGPSGGGKTVIQRVDELPTPPRAQGFLKLPEAHRSVWIYVDGTFKGRVGDYPLRALLLPAGRRRLELRRHGHASRYELIELSAERPVTIYGDLTPLPEPPPRPKW